MGGFITQPENHHYHHQNSEINGLKLIVTIILNFLIAIAEITGGILAGSLSLISDALHNLSDGLALIISWLAIKIAGKANDEKRTFGYKRASILAAFINSAALIGISLFLFKEAYVKFFSREPINGTIVTWVALIGLTANFLGVLLLKRDATENLNLKAAYFHLLSDALSSVAVILGGLAILFFKVYWIDPILTVFISLYVLKESYDILRQTVNVLMQGVPPHLSLDAVVAAITGGFNVIRVHHVHIWNLDEKNVFFEAHLDVRDMMISEAELIGIQIDQTLKERFGITHTTLQFECAGCGEKGIINHKCCR
jgi:cobalt-zinc-cadmium efflux system protein